MAPEPTISVRLANIGDLEACAATLAAAFEDYPWTRHVIPDVGYLARLRALQRLYLGYAQEHGFVAAEENGDGVIAFVHPHAAGPDQRMVDEVIALHGDRLDRLGGPSFTDGAWRLETLGVRPLCQGRGIASTLLRFGLAEVARRGGGPVTLETSDSRNVRLYERHGFRVSAQTEVADAPTIWRMETHVAQ